MPEDRWQEIVEYDMATRGLEVRDLRRTHSEYSAKVDGRPAVVSIYRSDDGSLQWRVTPEALAGSVKLLA